MTSELLNATTSPLSAKRSRGVAITRLVLAWLVTMLVLLYAWARAMTFAMMVGWPEPLYVWVFLAGLVAVWGLTFRQGLAFPPRMSVWLVGLAVMLPWAIFNVILVAMYNGERLATPVLVAFFVPATLWVPWAAWMFFAPTRLAVQCGVLGGLFAVAGGGIASLRIDDMAGAG